MEIDGLPLHALVLHAAVVFTPLAGLFAIVFAALPRWRYLTRWPTAALTLIALGSVWMARISGMALASDRGLDQLPAVQKHQTRGMQLSLLMILFTVVVAVAGGGVRGSPGVARRRGGGGSRVG